MIYVTKVYVVRHCETDGNALKIFQGHTDNDINEMGAKQLVALGEKFKDIPLDKIYKPTNKGSQNCIGNFKKP